LTLKDLPEDRQTTAARAILDYASHDDGVFGCPAVRASETFVDGLALLRAAEARGLEGIVSKRRNAPFA
jgi:ATP-dependent DNA ligase